MKWDWYFNSEKSNIILLNVRLLFCVPSKYNNHMLEKLRMETQIWDWDPNIPLLYFEGLMNIENNHVICYYGTHVGKRPKL